jgi:hypothetical protein
MRGVEICVMVPRAWELVLVDFIVTIANSIVQAAGTDLYKQARDLLAHTLSRFVSRRTVATELETTRARLRTGPDLRSAEVERWTRILRDLLAANPGADTELPALSTQLLRLQSGQVYQSGYAHRDQYNIAGDSTFIRYKN